MLEGRTYTCSFMFVRLRIQIRPHDHAHFFFLNLIFITYPEGWEGLLATLNGINLEYVYSSKRSWYASSESLFLSVDNSTDVTNPTDHQCWWYCIFLYDSSNIIFLLFSQLCSFSLIVNHKNDSFMHSLTCLPLSSIIITLLWKIYKTS